MAAASLAGSAVVALESTGISKKSGITAGDRRVFFYSKNAFPVTLECSVSDSQCRSRVSSSGVRTQVATTEQASIEEAPVAIVTGASTGIGKAVALSLGKAGCKVLVHYSQSSKDAEDICKEIVAVGGHALAFRGDLANEEDIFSMINTAVYAWGAVDILVHYAGTMSDILWSLKPSQRLEWLESSIRSSIGGSLCMTEAAGIMRKKKKRQGRIINIACVVGTDAYVGKPNYDTITAGIISFSESLARRYLREGITLVSEPKFLFAMVIYDVYEKLEKPDEWEILFINNVINGKVEIFSFDGTGEIFNTSCNIKNDNSVVIIDEVNVITPTFVASDRSAMEGEEFEERLLEKMQLGRYDQFEAVVGLVEYFAFNPGSKDTTGQLIAVNGGTW